MYTEYIIFPCISWEKSSLAFCPRKHFMFSGKDIPSFQIIQERSCPGAAPFEKTFFLVGLEKILYFLVFFLKKIIFHFLPKVKIIFSRRETWSFLIIRERSYYSVTFLERTSFQDVWKKKIWFSVQWLHKPLLALASITNQKVLCLVLSVKFWLSCLFL